MSALARTVVRPRRRRARGARRPAGPDQHAQRTGRARSPRQTKHNRHDRGAGRSALMRSPDSAQCERRRRPKPGWVPQGPAPSWDAGGKQASKVDGFRVARLTMRRGGHLRMLSSRAPTRMECCPRLGMLEGNKRVAKRWCSDHAGDELIIEHALLIAGKPRAGQRAVDAGEAWRASCHTRMSENGARLGHFGRLSTAEACGESG